MIEDVDISTLVNDPANVRTHDRRNLDAIKGSLAKFGQQKPIVIDAKGVVIAGNGTLAAARELGWQKIAVVRSDLAGVEATAYAIADNRTAELAAWDGKALAETIASIAIQDEDLAKLLDFPQADLDALIGMADATEVVEDEVPEPPPVPITKPGDLWLLGDHRLLCGDSTKAEDVARLMGGEKAVLLHADPPYGMGKEADGVENDNLYADKLDAFQMAWWRAFRPHVSCNASVYVWGNAPDLWRLWYRGGLDGSERLEVRNEIVWNKKNIAGMASPLMLQYPIASERCLFFQIGNQFVGNVNASDFPETWEPVLAYMASEAAKAKITPQQIRDACGCGMYSHWFTKSQFTLIPKRHYATLAAHFPKRFLRPWEELKTEWDRVKGGPQSEVSLARSYFDNSHDAMTDVWEYDRVVGEERHGHATPKPVAMICRAIKSSSPDGGVVVDPFLGSGTTLIAAEQLGRRCYGIEISPQYVDVCVARWEKLTGKQATLGTKKGG